MGVWIACLPLILFWKLNWIHHGWLGSGTQNGQGTVFSVCSTVWPSSGIGLRSSIGGWWRGCCYGRERMKLGPTLCESCLKREKHGKLKIFEETSLICANVYLACESEVRWSHGWDERTEIKSQNKRKEWQEMVALWANVSWVPAPFEMATKNKSVRLLKILYCIRNSHQTGSEMLTGNCVTFFFFFLWRKALPLEEAILAGKWPEGKKGDVALNGSCVDLETKSYRASEVVTF